MIKSIFTLLLICFSSNIAQASFDIRLACSKYNTREPGNPLVYKIEVRCSHLGEDYFAVEDSRSGRNFDSRTVPSQQITMHSCGNILNHNFAVLSQLETAVGLNELSSRRIIGTATGYQTIIASSNSRQRIQSIQNQNPVDELHFKFLATGYPQLQLEFNFLSECTIQ